MFNREDVAVLLVEDDEIDVEVVKRSFAKKKLKNKIHVVNDGQKALEALRHDLISKPYIVLMDLNLPKINGLECIHQIREDPKLENTIVFVLTTSKSTADIKQAYHLNVAGYFIKSNVGTGFSKVTHLLNRYWIANEFPPD